MKNSYPTITTAFVLFILTLVSAPVSSQLSLGLTFQKVESRATPGSRILGTPDGRFAYEFGFNSEQTPISVGLSLYKSFTKLYFNTDIMYRQTSSRYMVRDYFEEVRPQAQYIVQKEQQLHIPVTAGVNFRNLKIGVGAFFNVNFDSDMALSKAYPFEDKNRKLDSGMIISAGYKMFNRVLVHARYEKGFVNVGNSIYYNQVSTRIRSCMSNLTVGVTLYPLGMD